MRKDRTHSENPRSWFRKRLANSEEGSPTHCRPCCAGRKGHDADRLDEGTFLVIGIWHDGGGFLFRIDCPLKEWGMSDD